MICGGSVGNLPRPGQEVDSTSILWWFWTSNRPVTQWELLVGHDQCGVSDAIKDHYQLFVVVGYQPLSSANH